METTRVVASRYWGNPVRLSVDDEKIHISVSMEDFLTALKVEMGSVTWTFTDAKFSAKLDAAVTSVMEKFKQEAAIKEIASQIPIN